ncbi:hypothetical protein [Streptomyces sp. TS71-3]|uniref:hypothetical protein n=1 Tax=Streptomyces sp. TS71-3 TaxID=2733862 RepID=UPI001B04B6BF|nr:hypothetical protein [Streptomyces sp. TS71-3]GHJ42012.1 hypothetical protein Sm713_76210 [Streptomyces sp. TS71-3]
MVRRPRKGEAAQFARRLELDVCAGRLIGHLLADAPAAPGVERVPWERRGRYPALERLIAGDERLRLSLLAEDQEAIRSAWATCLADTGADTRLHHTLAVVHHERAAALVDDGVAAAGLLARTTTLWALLLASPAFWREFPHHDATWLRADLCRELMGRHRSRAAAALDQAAADPGRRTVARRHLEVLDACRRGESAVRADMPYAGLVETTGDTEAWQEISRLAAEVLDDWSHEVIGAAERAVDDPEAIAALPSGIPRDFESGVRALTPLVELGVPLPRVLVTGLGWCNELQRSLYKQPGSEKTRQLRVKRVLGLARVFAEPLTSLATKGNSMLKENQALSEHHLFRGWVDEDTDRAVASYQEALAWNPNNHNAAELQKQRRFTPYITAVVKALNDNRTEAAGRAVRELERHVTNDEERAWGLFFTAVVALRGLPTESTLRRADELFEQALSLGPPAALREQIERARSQLLVARYRNRR